MKYPIILLTALLLSSCAGSMMELGFVTQDPCRDQTALKDSGEFLGETVDKLMVSQQGDLVLASMEVRTFCNAKINFEVERSENLIRLKLYNEGPSSADCVCMTMVRSSLKNVEEGTYNVQVVNKNGSRLLAQTTVTVTE